jgi:hypothetical protein
MIDVAVPGEAARAAVATRDRAVDARLRSRRRALSDHGRSDPASVGVGARARERPRRSRGHRRGSARRRPVDARCQALDPRHPDRVAPGLGRPRAARGQPPRDPRVHRPGPAPPTRVRGVGLRPEDGEGSRTVGVVRRSSGYRQDDGRRHHRQRARPRPLPARSLAHRLQVRRREREEPRRRVRRRRGRARDPAVRRGRLAVCQADRGQILRRSLRESRGQLPAPADGDVQRHHHPHDQPGFIDR